MSQHRENFELTREFYLIGTQLCLYIDLSIVVPDPAKMRTSLEREGFGHYDTWLVKPFKYGKEALQVRTNVRLAIAKRRVGISTRKAPPKFFRSSATNVTYIKRLSDQFDVFEADYRRALLDAYYKIDKVGLTFPEVEDLHRLFLIAKDMRC